MHRRPHCHSRKYRDPGLSRGKHIPASHRPESTPELQATCKLTELTNKCLRNRNHGHASAKRGCEKRHGCVPVACAGGDRDTQPNHATRAGPADLPTETTRPWPPSAREQLTGLVIRGTGIVCAGRRQRAQARPCDCDSGSPRHRAAQRFLHRITRVRTSHRVHSSTHTQKKCTHMSTQNPYADARGSSVPKSRPKTRKSRVRWNVCIRSWTDDTCPP